ncbi:hypothetical protein AHAS_Ahas19G0244900 [Arachis hypogaea]
MSGDMKEKCYLWATRVKTYADGSTNEYDPMCTLNAQEPLLLPKVHFASLKASSYIESEVYAGGTSQEKDREIEPPYIDISGQKTSYDCAVYVMKWLEIIQLQNIKRGSMSGTIGLRYFLAEIEGLEHKSDSEVEEGLLMLLDSDLSALKVDFLELQNSKWRDSNCVGK